MTSPDPDSPHALEFSRLVPLPPDTMWKAWTEPRFITQWFTPAPWQTLRAETDVRPGGRFRTVMRGPGGPEIDNTGCYLVTIRPTRLIWTNALGPGFAPQNLGDGWPVTVDLTFTADPDGTLYTARALHRNAEDRAKHAAMNFAEGWGKALDQLIAMSGKIT